MCSVEKPCQTRVESTMILSIVRYSNYVQYTAVVYYLPSASTSKTVASLTPSCTPDSDAGTSSLIRNVSSASTIPSALMLVYIDKNT